MRLAKLVAIGAMAIGVIGCSSAATAAPQGGGIGSPASTTAASIPPSVPASVAASATASATTGGGGATGDLSALATAPTAKVCALLSTDEAKTLLGKPIAVAPNGMSLKGLGTNCFYQVDSSMDDGTYIKVEIDAVSYKANLSLLALGGGPTATLTVGGFTATSIDLGGTGKQATIVIALGDPASPPSVVIQAPTVDMAKSVAEKILGRLDSLK